MLKIQINGLHRFADGDILKYVTKKIGKLEKYIPKYARESAHCEVFLKESKTKSKTNEQFTCEVVLHLPHENIATEETTLNIFAAVDIVEEKLKNQLHRYKQKHSTKVVRRKFLKVFRRKSK